MTVEDMQRLEQAFESRPAGNRDDDIVANIREGLQPNETLEQAIIAERYPDIQILKDRYPDILDRELLASVLEKKYLAPDSSYTKELEALERRHEAAIEQGHPPIEYTDHIVKKSKVSALVDFLTKLNDHEYEKMSQGWLAQATIEEDDRRQAERVAEIREARELLYNHHLYVPSEKNPSGQVDITLFRFVDGLAYKLIRGEMDGTEESARIKLLKETIEEVFRPELRAHLYRLFEGQMKGAKAILENYEIVEKTRQLTEDERKEYTASLKEYYLARFRLQIIAKIFE